MKTPTYLFRNGFFSLLSVSMMLLIVAGFVYLFLESQLPNVDALKDVRLQVPLRIYSFDGVLIGQFGEKRRRPIPISQVPQPLINAILATEDQRFFEHPGVDIFGLARAAIQLVRTGEKSQGGSTITMQVARNFFLTRKKTFVRKINEILLAIKIDHELSKEKILELYLNKIYFGSRSYGVAAAAQVYYGLPLNELTLPQLAMIAGLPKAPSALNPTNHPARAKERRNHVLERMLEEAYINYQTYEEGINSPVTASYHSQKQGLHAPYVAEMIRKTMVTLYGKQAYTHGYRVYATVDSHLQETANNVVRNALLNYDQRHGYRGPFKNLGPLTEDTFQKWLTELATVPNYNHLIPSAVAEVYDNEILVLTADAQTHLIPWSGLKWARPALGDNQFGRKPSTAADIVKAGDVVYVDKTNTGEYRLSQVPEIEGALVSLHPQDGAIQALVGGFDFYKSNFNRVTQAQRQAGSSFKPFVYSAALEKSYTLASIINDAPVVLSDPSLENLWRPQNDTRKFYGPTRLRVGITRSRNLVSIRLLESIGINYAIGYLQRFGFEGADLPRSLSLALGSATLTPLQLTSAYAVFANGGYRIEPYIIARVTDTLGETIADNALTHTPTEETPVEPVITSQNAYLITSTLQDVIQHGTGRGAKVLHRNDLSGKTGTTNDQMDAWFSGFNGDIVTTAWLGFDTPQSLYEYAAKAALPMWIDFMKVALHNKPSNTLPQPQGIVTARIDPKTGLLATPNQKSIFELFRKENVPTHTTNTTTTTKTQNQQEETPVEYLF